jgi:hypothetical protein
VAGLVLVLLAAGAAAAWIATSGRAAVSAEEDDVERERAEDDGLEPAPPVDELVPADDKPAQPDDQPTETGPRTRACAGARAVTMPVLRRHLAAIGWRVTGKLIYCPGSMVNFRCVGVRTRGVTVSSGDQEGSVAILRFKSAGAAGSYVAGERKPLSLATEGRTVLRVELPAAAADRLLGRVCK